MNRHRSPARIGARGFLAERLPALPRLVHCDDRPTTFRSARGMEDLPLRQSASSGMNGRDDRLVLLGGCAGEEMSDPVRQGAPSTGTHHIEAQSTDATPATGPATAPGDPSATCSHE